MSFWVRALPFALVPPVVVGISACSSGGDRSDDLFLDALPTVTLIEELRIGSVDDPEYGFSRIRAPIHVTEGDTIYLLESGVPEIRVYSPDGHLVRTIGRSGEGPGEFDGVLSWGLAGDTVWAIGLDRATLFRRDGSLISTSRIEPIRLTYAETYTVIVRAQEVLPGGTMRGSLNSYTPARPGGPSVDAQVPIVTWAWGGGVIDTVGYETLSLRPEDIDFVSVGGMNMARGFRPSAYALRAPLEDDTIRVERAVAETSDEGVLEILRKNPAGDTTWHRSIRYKPVPIGSAYRDSLMTALTESYTRLMGGEQAARSAMEEITDFHPFFPPVSSLDVLQDGSIWLRRSPGPADAWKWVVFNEDGTVQGEVTTPPQTDIVWSDGGVVYAIEEDLFEVPWLVRYRITER